LTVDVLHVAKQRLHIPGMSGHIALIIWRKEKLCFIMGDF